MRPAIVAASRPTVLASPCFKKPLLLKRRRIESKKTLVRLVLPSKRYFASPFRVDNERAGNSGKVLPGLARNRKLAGRANQRAHGGFLSLA